MGLGDNVPLTSLCLPQCKNPQENVKIMAEHTGNHLFQEK